MERQPDQIDATPDEEAGTGRPPQERNETESSTKGCIMNQQCHVVGLDDRVPIVAWISSVTFHAAAMGIVLLIAGRMVLAPQDEPFRWNVAMVERVQQQETVAPPQSEPEPTPISAPRRVVKSVAPPVPIEPPREIPPPPAPQMVESKPVDPVVEPAVEPIEPPTPQVTEYHAAPVESAPAAEPVEAATPQSAPQAAEPAVAQVEPSKEPAAMTAPTEPSKAVQEERPLVAAGAAPIPRPDYGWVRDAIWRRIVEMKHYPSQARLNHWEGKVVLRAVIRSDGHLGDLLVKETSGHRVLDDAALEVVRRICPIRLKHELGRPEIVVMIPIDYRLD
jgi:periplasmic protein TonB